MRGKAFAALLVLCTFACGHAAGLPYATVDGKCIDETTLENAINAGPLQADAKTKTVDSCKRACDRVVETIKKMDESSGTDNCQKTAEKLYEIMDTMTSGSFDSKLVNDNLHFLFIKQNAQGYPISCIEQLEVHWANREKFCVPSLDQNAYETSDNKAAANAASRASALRQFILNFMHKGESSHGWCLETMYNIVTAPPPYATNGFLTTDKGGKCSSLIKSKWDTCDADCKAQITSAIKLANKRSTAWKAPDSTKDASDHEPDCCMASYYDEVMAFTYGNNNYDKTKSTFIPETTALPSGCDKNILPCTSVGEAMYKCNIDDKYLAYHCAHGAGAGALAASLLMALGAATVTLMSV